MKRRYVHNKISQGPYNNSKITSLKPHYLLIREFPPEKRDKESNFSGLGILAIEFFQYLNNKIKGD